MKLEFRQELEEDYRYVEEMIKRAFWNLHVPGCDEHYVANKIRNHKDYIKELSYIATIDDKIVAQIMYTKSYIQNADNVLNEVITFGPVCVEPEYQGRGIGKKLINYTLDTATNLGYKCVVILGFPKNYTKFNFKSCKKFNIYMENESNEKIFPAGMLVLPLLENSLENLSGKIIFSDVFEVDIIEVEKFDKDFFQLPKENNKEQEEFYIMSNAVLV